MLDCSLLGIPLILHMYIDLLLWIKIYTIYTIFDIIQAFLVELAC